MFVRESGGISFPQHQVHFIFIFICQETGKIELGLAKLGMYDCVGLEYMPVADIAKLL